MSTKDSDNYVTVVLLILALLCGPLFFVALYGGDIGELIGRTAQ